MVVQSFNSAQHLITVSIRVRAMSVVLACSCVCCRNEKAPECAVLVPAMGELGERLAAARGVLSEPDVDPEFASDVLKPFAETAKKAAQRLETQVPSDSKLRKVSEQASAAADALGTRAAQMAEYASQMRDMDAANKAVDENKQRVD